MDEQVRKHAEMIYAMLLAGWAASSRELPTASEAPKHAEMAIIYAKAFAEAVKKSGG